MRKLTRRTMLAGAAATAATALAPIPGLHRFAKADACIQSLKDFLVAADQQQLTGADRETIVTKAIKLLDGFYCHLPIKQKLYNVDPLGRLRQLQIRAAQFNSDRPFHAEMMEIFTELHDMHTRYRPPTPYGSAHAFLPFRVEACKEDGRRKYIATLVLDNFITQPTFVRGVEILQWNGDPIEQAIARAGGEGATLDARNAVGLARLTYRALQLQAVPDADTVRVRYRTDDNRELDIEIPWKVWSVSNDCSICTTAQIQNFGNFLFAPYNLCDDVIKSETHTTPNGDTFGYIRIYSFPMPPADPDQFVQKFRSAIAQFTNAKGLIVDVRDNGGGSIRLSERIVQWVAPTPGAIEPSKLYFRATQAALDLCQLPMSVVGGLGLPPDGSTAWVPSIQRALQNREPFSDAFHYTADGDANTSGRQPFPRPVIVVTDALTFSSAEFFAAGFKDHGGKILGVHETTGGGGANFRQLTDLGKYFTDSGMPSPFAALPNGAGFQVAFRRSKRVGLGAGKEIEDAGVERDFAHEMTRNDLLNKNQDLKNHAAALLAQM